MNSQNNQPTGARGSTASWLVPLLTLLAAVGFASCVWMVFVVTPVADVLFFNQKIFYFHVANAFMLFLSVFVCGFASVVFLKKRDGKWDDIAIAGAEVAVMFGLVVLITGSIWAKAAWDVWWKWEKRLTMSLLLWLVLVAYVIVRRFAGASADRLAAGLAVFGCVGIPFIYFMVEKSDNHPQAGKEGVVATLATDMKLAFWGSVLTFFFWFVALLISRIHSARAEREVRELRESAMDAGVL
ncbi:MAG TPA: cytochrome c biogenesis protein [Kofleriaceae bacterium]|nr:cytochrome c biogenesis protein [Kofleriaceae bacterium]